MKDSIQTDRAPRAIGPYSQAIKAGGFLFASGQIPIDPESGQFVAGGIEEQTEQVLKNLSAVLQAAGSSLERVVKTTVFLADMDERPRHRDHAQPEQHTDGIDLRKWVLEVDFGEPVLDQWIG